MATKDQSTGLQGNVESLHDKMNQTLRGDFSALGQDLRDVPGDVGSFFGGIGRGIGDIFSGGSGSHKTIGGVDWLMNAIGQLEPSKIIAKATGKAKPAGALPSPANDVAGTGGPLSQPDPLAMQSFFQTTIAPYLNTLVGNLGQVGQQYGQAMQAVQPHVNPALRGMFNPAQRQAQVNTLANALAGSVAAGPTLQQLMSGINEAADMQRFAAYEAMKSQVGGAANPFAALGLPAGTPAGAASGYAEGLAEALKKQ